MLDIERHTIAQTKRLATIGSGIHSYLTVTATEHPPDARIIGKMQIGIAQCFFHIIQARCVKNTEQGIREQALMTNAGRAPNIQRRSNRPASKTMTEGSAYNCNPRKTSTRQSQPQTSLPGTRGCRLMFRGAAGPDSTEISSTTHVLQ
jgi:hypothetical protein